MMDMSEREPTNGDTPRPSASPEPTDRDAHRAALFAPDPAFHFHKQRNEVPDPADLNAEPELADPVVIPDAALTPVEEVAPPETADTIDAEVPPVETGASDPDASDFVQWLAQHGPVVPSRKPKRQYEEDALTQSAKEKDEKKKKKKKKKGDTKKKKKKGKKKQKKSAAKKARKLSDAGFSLGDDIVSEPLAEVLAAQGHQGEAIAMYQRLSLIYPEKSRLFAAKIEELKQNA